MYIVSRNNVLLYSIALFCFVAYQLARLQWLKFSSLIKLTNQVSESRSAGVLD